jgi:hypothetical protein
MNMTAVNIPQTSGDASEIQFCAWIAQAEAGETLVYHQGFLVVDADPVISKLSAEQRLALRALASAAFRAEEQGLVHLVQQRMATNRFAYIAIACPNPKSPRPAAITRLLEAA